MDQDKKELTTAAADAAAMTYLQQSGVELADLFTRDILLMHTSVAGVMFTDHFREHAAELKKGDPVSFWSRRIARIRWRFWSGIRRDGSSAISRG